MDYYALKEGINLELKAAQGGVPQSIWETYSSFANTQGGTIILGIREGIKANTIEGLTNPEKIKQEIINELNNRNKISVNLLAETNFRIEEIDGKKILVIDIPQALPSQKPIYLNGNLNNSYYRLGEGDFKCPPDMIAGMLIDNEKVNYDQRPNTATVLIDDLHQETIKEYRSAFNVRNKNEELASLSDLDFLERLGGIARPNEDSRALTNATIAVFGDARATISKIYPNYFLDYEEKTTDESRYTLRYASDDLSWSGNLYDFYLKVSSLMMSFIPNQFELQGMQNVGGQELSEALREALLNAIFNAHFFYGSGLVVIKKPRSISISNPGKMLVGLEQAKIGGVTQVRNPGIMSYFRYLGLGERMGQGIPKVFEIFHKLGFPEPNLFEQVNPDRTIIELTLIPVRDMTKNELSEKIYALLLKNKEGFTVKDLASKLSVSNSSIRNAMNILKESNLVNDNGMSTNQLKYLAVR